MEYSTQINEKIAKNLAYYRKAAGLTQAELAEKINYSDKSVSKWESGGGVPDIYILLQLANLYKITVGELIGEEPPKQEKTALTERKRDGLHLLIMLLSSGIVWLVATFVFVTLQLINPEWTGWLAFLYAVPVNCILFIVYAGVWKYRILSFGAVSLLVWSALTDLFLSLRLFVSGGENYGALWCLFLLGVPLQALEILWVFFRSLLMPKKKNVQRKNADLQTSEAGGGNDGAVNPVGGGEEGVKVLTAKIKAEMEDAMAMCGVHSLKEITREMLF